MHSRDESRLEEGFAGARAQARENRAAFLEVYCKDDQKLRSDIEELLQLDREDDDLLERPALELKSVRDALTNSPAGRRVGPYEIVDELGRGGMAVVYLGRRADGSFDKKVAIKVLDRFHSISSDEARFRQERHVLGQLDTPYIAKIIDAGVDDGMTYFVMEYVDGVHIDAYCRENRLSIPERLQLFLKVCEAVSIAHNSKIVHRDLKPANILVDKTGAPKLIDFGIAKVLDATIEAPDTLPGLELMTIQYASPEQLGSDPVLANLPSSDIYSLGVVLYELLTGHRPIEPPTTVSRVDLPRFLRETEPTPSSKYDRSLAGDLDLIVLKALNKERKKRFTSVEQFAAYITLYLGNHPLPEGPPGILYKAGKFVKRNRMPVAVSALLLATLLGGIIATERQARIAQRRFGDVRQLATSFLFDFDGAIANIAGATSARKLVVAKGLEYLDKLERDASGDDSLREEIASAYERLAGIQGNVYASNLGEYQQASDSYEKALAIRKDLVRKHPANEVLKRSLGNSYLLLADGWFTKGDTKTATAQYREGMGILAGLALSGDQSHDLLMGMQRGYSRLCNFLLAAGDHSAAMDNCQSAIKISQAIVKANPTDPAARAALAAAYGQTGNVLRIDKKPSEAIPQLELAASEFQKLLSEQPDNNAFARNLAGSYTLLGTSYTAVGETHKAIENFERSIETVRGMIKVDSVDARPKTTLAISLIRLAPALLNVGRVEDAMNCGREGLEIFRSFADRPQATPDDLNNYAAYLNDFGIPELRNPQRALLYSRRATSSVKEPSLVLLSTLADIYFSVGDSENAIATAKRALASNPAPKGSGEAGVRADLEQRLQQFEKALAERASKSK